jgi:PAS domain S-box-containing protein
MSNAAARQLEPSLPDSAVMTWYQVTLSAIRDAVLTTDPEGRVTYMKPVAESLTGWVAEVAHGRPLEEVPRIVNEETRQAVEQPARKVLETGLVRGMANHTLLIAKDGTERPIDDSAAR